MKPIIGYTNYYVPGHSLAIDEYLNLLQDSFLREINMTRGDLAGILKNSIGIERVYMEDRKNEAGIFSDMLAEYFDGGDTKPEDIDFVIYTRGNSLALGDPWSMTDDLCINIPYFLQEKFRMSNAQVFNVEQVCAGTLVACRLALSLIGDGSTNKMLLLSSNFFSDPGNRLMGGLGLVSDGMGIMEISAGNSGLSLVDFIGKTDGGITMVKAYREGANPATIVKVGCDLMNELARRNNLNINDISLIIPQNISNSGWNFYCQLLGFSKENVFLDTFTDGGHMADVDIIRNLTEVRRTRPLNPGDFAIIYGLGTGTSWSSLLLREL